MREGERWKARDKDRQRTEGDRDRETTRRERKGGRDREIVKQRREREILLAYHFLHCHHKVASKFNYSFSFLRSIASNLCSEEFLSGLAWKCISAILDQCHVTSNYYPSRGVWCRGWQSDILWRALHHLPHHHHHTTFEIWGLYGRGWRKNVGFKGDGEH